MNRIQNAIDKIERSITGKIINGEISKEEVERLKSSFDMTISEHWRFQELKSLAVMDGRLSLDEAQYVYNLLGNAVSRFNKQSLGVKVTLTQLFKELLQPMA